MKAGELDLADLELGLILNFAKTKLEAGRESQSLQMRPNSWLPGFLIEIEPETPNRTQLPKRRRRDGYLQASATIAS